MRNVSQLESSKGARDLFSQAHGSLRQPKVREGACVLEARGGTQRIPYIGDGWANLQARGKKESQTQNLPQARESLMVGTVVGRLGRMKPPFFPLFSILEIKMSASFLDDPSKFSDCWPSPAR